MVLSVPGTAEMKSDMIEFLRSNSSRLFANHVVHMLMVALTIFSGDDVDNKGIRNAGSTADFRILFEIFKILEIFDFFETLIFLYF